MAIKKSQLYEKLWKSCDDLRGGMDSSQYKDYILVLLFVKYASDKYANSRIVDIPKGARFEDMVKLVGKPNIGEEINKIIGKFAEANNLKGIIDNADFNDEDKLGQGKSMTDRLSSLVSIFESSFDFSKNRAEGDDLLGDAYEYLMRKFATESGKSKGQFYTPSEVSQIIAKVIEANTSTSRDTTVYDPTCGSGSLLLKVADESPNGLTIYGQEIDGVTRSMAIMNMWIHENQDASIVKEDTISKPQFKEQERLKEFDFAVANPPFSTKSWSMGIVPDNDEFGRFDGHGIPPKKNGDYAFLLHLIKSMKKTGKGAIVLPHGVLFRGNAESEIRKNLVERRWIKGIIGLPPNLFYGTGIPACIIVLDKKDTENRKGIFMIDASKGFVKDGNKNRLQAKDIHKIVDVFTNQIEISKFSRLVSISEIKNEKNNYNLNIPRYIDSYEEEDIQDIDGHLNGGIPISDVDSFNWKEFSNLKETLFSTQREGYLKLNVEKSALNSFIVGHCEFKKHSKKVEKAFESWKSQNLPIFEGITKGSQPKEIIRIISDDLIEKFSKFVLFDKYDIYQKIMTYWEETMQDDVYLISQEGFDVSLFPTKNKNGKIISWDSDLIPKETEILVRKYFAKQQEELEKLSLQLEETEQSMQDLEDEGEADDDMFSEARGKAGKITKGELTKRIKIIQDDSELKEEYDVLKEYQKLMDKKDDLTSQIKNLEKNLDKDLHSKYKTLKESEIREIVIYDKWLEAIHKSINEESQRLSNDFAGKIKNLAERYASTLPDMTRDVQELTVKVDQHLERMGFKW